MMKKVISFLLLVSSLLGFWFAETVSFEVIIEPDTISVWELADITIKALDANGNIDQDFASEAIMKVDWFDVLSEDVELPSLWYYEFKASDQWVKIFSKGFTVKTAWTYEVIVEDLFAWVSNITWKAVIKVNEEGAWTPMWTLEVTSPVPNAELTDEKIQVIAKTSLLNHPMILYIDDEKVDERISDDNGDITITVSWIEHWEHNLLLNAVDLWWTVVASSEVIPFTYQPLDHGALFVWLEVLPGNKLVEWDKATLKITTADVVDEVTVKIWEWDPIPTSKTKNWVFTKDLLLEEAGVYSVDLGLTVNWTETMYEDVDTITVTKDIKKIVTLNYEPVLQQDKVNLTWTYEWRVEYFKMAYGQNKSNLDLSLTSTIPNWTILLADPTKTRYAQVHPVDKDGNIVGESSQVITIDPLRKAAPICWNRLIELWEECDDGNIINQDGCSATCRIESAVCWNRRIELWEECDDGNIFDGDGCSSACKIQELQAPPQQELEECQTWGILLQTKVVDGKYFLYWAPVSNARKYLIYRQESRPWSIAQMSLVWETRDPIFEYPFDPNASVDQFAWYAVEAVCASGEQMQLWDFEKVKVGPEETLMIMLLMILILRWFRKITI